MRGGLQGSTVNVKLKALRAALTAARKKQYILANPAEEIDLLRARKAEREPFKKGQVRELISVANDEWRGMILLGEVGYTVRSHGWFRRSRHGRLRIDRRF
jgi:hypothetical protein